MHAGKTYWGSQVLLKDPCSLHMIGLMIGVASIPVTIQSCRAWLTTDGLHADADGRSEYCVIFGGSES